MNTAIDRWTRLGAILFFWLVVIFCVYRIGSDTHIYLNTGTLKVSVPDKTDIVTVSQPGSQAVLIGTGSSSAHLKPGQYFVVAQGGGRQAGKSVRITNRQVSSISIDPEEGYIFPSVSSVSFSGISDLVDNGISDTQAAKVELDLFKFKPTARFVGIYDIEMFRKSTTPVSVFEINFTANIDSVLYKATISYSNINDINMQLYNSAGVSVFNSSN